jgi:hypothetical protein
MTTSFERLACSLTLATLGLSGAACSSGDQATTTGKRIVLATRFEPSADVAGELTTSTKWTVRLSSAFLAVGGLYYFDGQPAFVRLERPAPRRSPFERVKELFIGTAYAHPQHYVAGNALGEMVEPSSVDLFEAADLPDGRGVTGTFRSGRLTLPDSIEGPVAEALGTHVASATGVATKDARSVYFQVAVELSDIQALSPDAAIDGCVFEEVDVTTDGKVTLTVTPRVWFNLVDFADVESGTEDEPTPIVRGQTAHKGFALGVAQLTAYHFHYTP